MRLFSIFLFSFIVGCAYTKNVDNELTIKDDEAAIFEAVLRFAFANNASALKNSADFYAIELNGHDASSSFIARFSDIKKPLYPISKTELDCKNGVYLKNDGKRGIQFFVNSIDPESDTKIKVSWSYYEGCMSSAFSVMTLELKDGIWVVLDNEIIVIS